MGHLYGLAHCTSLFKTAQGVCNHTWTFFLIEVHSHNVPFTYFKCTVECAAITSTSLHNVFITPEEAPYALSSHPSFPSFLILWKPLIYLFWTFDINGIIYMGFLCVCVYLLSFHIMCFEVHPPCSVINISVLLMTG